MLKAAPHSPVDDALASAVVMQKLPLDVAQHSYPSAGDGRVEIGQEEGMSATEWGLGEGGGDAFGQTFHRPLTRTARRRSGTAYHGSLVPTRPMRYRYRSGPHPGPVSGQGRSPPAAPAVSCRPPDVLIAATGI